MCEKHDGSDEDVKKILSNSFVQYPMTNTTLYVIITVRFFDLTNYVNIF